MLTIFRYTVSIDDRWHALPIVGEVLHVGRPPATMTPSQFNGLPPAEAYDLGGREHQVELWAHPAPDGPRAERHFRVYGTGHPIEDPCRHIGTAFGAGGRLVWHLMERHP